MNKLRETVEKEVQTTGSAQAASPWLVGLAFMAIYFIWGSTYLAALIGLEGFPPFVLAGSRFSLAGILLLGWCLCRGEQWPNLRSIAGNSLSGVLMLAGGTGSVIWAEQYISSGLAAILIAMEPFWFVVLDKKAWPVYFSTKVIPLGLGIGLLGFLLLFLWPEKTNQFTWGSLPITGSVAVLLGGLSWVVGSLYAKYRITSHSTWINSSLQLLVAGIFCLLLGALLGEWQTFSLTSVSLRAWIALVFMVVMGSIVAYTAYLWLLTVRPPAVVGTHTYVNPLVAVVLGWVFAYEPVLTSQVVALLVILLGVLLVNLPKYRNPG